MYLDFWAKIPNATGKITYRRKGDLDYVYYKYDRIYDKATKKTNPKRVTRGRKPGITISLEQQIEKAQERVIKTKTSYENAVEELQKLLDKRDAKRRDELGQAIIKSPKSYKDILNYIKADQTDDD